MKYIFINLEIRNGEYSYNSVSVWYIKDFKGTLDDYAEDHASTFYGGTPYKQDGGYYFFAGEVFVSVDQVKEITKEDYDVLTKYI